jgi:thiamine-phosphate pyrophosphorylase
LAPAPSASLTNLLTLCLITDRRRLMAGRGLDEHDWATVLLQQVRGAVAGGVDVVQIRERGLDDRDYAAFARACIDFTRGSATRIILNDRVDIALATGAHGVHLREDSLAIDDTRQLVQKEFLIGRSIHDPATAALARTADYLIAGSVFETASKPGRQASLGLDGLRTVVTAAAGCPVWAVGGITSARMQAVVECGVQGVAAIGAFIPAMETADIAAAVEEVSKGLRFSLASAVELP